MLGPAFALPRYFIPQMAHLGAERQHPVAVVGKDGVAKHDPGRLKALDQVAKLLDGARRRLEAMLRSLSGRIRAKRAAGRASAAAENRQEWIVVGLAVIEIPGGQGQRVEIGKPAVGRVGRLGESVRRHGLAGREGAGQQPLGCGGNCQIGPRR